MQPVLKLQGSVTNKAFDCSPSWTYSVYRIAALKKFAGLKNTPKLGLFSNNVRGLPNDFIKRELYLELLQRNAPTFFQNRYSTKQVWMTAPEGSLFFSQFLLRLSIQGYVMAIVSSIKIKSFCFKMGGMRIKRNQK